MIPKIIYTAWFSDTGEIPETLVQYIETQKLKGYAHITLTLDTVFKDHPYIQQCLNSVHKTKRWVKLADFCKLWYLYHTGGIFLDADVQVLRPFDEILNNKLVVGLEGRGTLPESVVIGNAIMASEPGNPVIKELLEIVVNQFRGDDTLCYEAGMDLINVLCIKYQDKIKILPPEYFYPYNHITGETNITDKSICIHYFTKTWIFPTIDFIIPQLGREEGLKRCIESINNLQYPKELVKIHVIEGEETVPEKLKKGVENSTGEYICYAANDMEFYPECIVNAITASKTHDKGLVSFNEGIVGPDNGNICTHFIIRRDLISKIGGEVFDTRLTHVGVDNLLWHKCSILNEAYWCESAKIKHKHFSHGSEFDFVYQKGWAKAKEDREKLSILKHNI